MSMIFGKTWTDSTPCMKRCTGSAEDVLDFIPDYANNQIIIRNRSQYGR